MSPLFVTGLGYGADLTGFFIGALIFGGALAQFPVGYLSDRTDRRYVLIGMSASALVIASFLPVIAGLGVTALIASGLLFGAAAVPNFGLIVAHANDHAEPGEAVSVNGALLLLFGSAAAFGPLIAGQLVRLFGSAALFWWIAGIYLVLTVFGLVRLASRAAPEDTGSYVPIPRQQPTTLELDPRVTGEERLPESTPTA
jgi:MFS family permease